MRINYKIGMIALLVSQLAVACAPAPYKPSATYRKLFLEAPKDDPLTREELGNRRGIPLDNDATYYLRPLSDYSDAPRRTTPATPPAVRMPRGIMPQDNDNDYYLLPDGSSDDAPRKPKGKTTTPYYRFTPEDHDSEYVAPRGGNAPDNDFDYPLYNLN